VIANEGLVVLALSAIAVAIRLATPVANAMKRLMEEVNLPTK